MGIPKPRKLAEGLYWVRSLERRKTPILCREGRVLPQDKIFSSVDEWMCNFLYKKGLESSYSSWGPDTGDESSMKWHKDLALGDRAVLMCILTDKIKDGTRFKLPNGHFYSFPWNIYAMDLDVEHRGPKNYSLRIVIRRYFDMNGNSLDGIFG